MFLSICHTVLKVVVGNLYGGKTGPKVWHKKHGEIQRKLGLQKLIRGFGSKRDYWLVYAYVDDVIVSGTRGEVEQYVTFHREGLQDHGG